MSNRKKNEIIIFGSAETAELAKYYFDNDSIYSVVAFCVDDAYVSGTSFCGLPLIPFSEVTVTYPPSEFFMHVSLSYAKLNQLRQEKYFQAKNAGYTLVSYISSKSVHWPDLNIGDNCFILENQTIQPNVQIGNNVMIWSGNHLGHGTIISDHTYISSHVVISGNCVIGERCFFGVNSTIKDFSIIGNDVFIAMGANVTKNLENGTMAIASKSEYFKFDSKLSKIIKKKTFGL
jgi:sugar O-acyltransferase (sialic acid O-acetyltransferase NeuD family)